jgi:hypothetical protein
MTFLDRGQHNTPKQRRRETFLELASLKVRSLAGSRLSVASSVCSRVMNHT